jgi:hypothetical protein
MKGRIYDTQVAALAGQAGQDARLGYPKYPDQEVGAPPFVDESKLLMTTYADPFKHPTQDRWALPTPDDDPEAAELSDDWFP